MTTESKQSRQSRTSPGAGVLLGAASVGLVAAVVALVVAVLVDGGEGGLGAIVGGLATLLVLGVGTWLVLRVAGAAPALSLVVALVVFTAQGGLLLLMLVVLSAATDGPQVSWAAVAVIAVTLAWTTTFAVRVRKERIPVFDLPGVGEGPGPAAGGPSSHEASTR